MKKYFPAFLIFLFTIFFYLPILLKPDILISRGNDLTEFFWPIFYFVRTNIFKYHELPFWNNLFFSGTPLLPDPQSPLFYLPNVIFLILKDIDTGFVVSVFLHIFVAGIGMYFLAKNGFKFSCSISLFSSFVYIASPKLSAYIEAGHFGLIASWAWLPFALLGIILLVEKPTLKKSIFISITLAGLFYTHILIFVIVTISLCIIFIYLTFSNKNNLIKNSLYFINSGIICFGLIAITFLPQLSWQKYTTRNLLLNSPDIYPKWISKIEFLKAAISPILYGHRFIWELDTEKTIGIGLFIIILSIIGFINLKNKHKISLLIIIFIIGLISLNNISPIYDFLIKENWYILMRVSTRFWFIVVFISIYLAGLGVTALIKNKKIRILIYVVMFLATLELLLTSWTKILKPVVKDQNLAPESVYQYLSQDKNKFRVFCLNRCLSQKESAIYGLELVDGYGTLQQTNYYTYSEQLSQSFYRDRYTLSIPPFEIFEYEKLQPYSPNLDTYNVKYLISDHLLTDKNLTFIKQFGQYLIYENKINLPRSNYPISFYSPNIINIDTSKFTTDNVVLSEVYNNDWKAYENNKKELQIIATPDQTREVKINKDIKNVEFIYFPKSFIIGSFVTIITVEALVILFFYRKYRFFIK